MSLLHHSGLSLEPGTSRRPQALLQLCPAGGQGAHKEIRVIRGAGEGERRLKETHGSSWRRELSRGQKVWGM